MEFIFILYLVFIIAPISVFIHEIGHGLASLLCRADQVNVSIGTGKELVTWNNKRLTITLNRIYFIGGHTSSYREEAYHKNELIFITLFGPVFNLFAFLVSLLFLSTNTNIVLLFILFNLWLAIGNLVPFKWKGKETDGYTILQLIRS